MAQNRTLPHVEGTEVRHGRYHLKMHIPYPRACVFSPPEHHRRRMRTSNPMERAIQQELKRRAVKVRAFPNEESPERLSTAVLVEIDDKWLADTKAYIKWERQDA